MRPKGKLFDLKKFRNDKNLSQKDISIATQRPQSFLSAIEHGKRSAPASFLRELAILYKVEDISIYLSERPKETKKNSTTNNFISDEMKNVQIQSPHSHIHNVDENVLDLIKELTNNIKEVISKREVTPEGLNNSASTDILTLLVNEQKRSMILEQELRDAREYIHELEDELENYRKGNKDKI